MKEVTLLAGVESLVLAAFAGLAVGSSVHWHREGGRPAAWLAALFGTLTLLAGIDAFTGPIRADEAGEVWVRAMVVLIALLPYCLYGFATSLGTRASRGRGPAVALAAVVAATFAVPSVATPVESLPWWYVAYTLGFLGYWAAMAAMAARRLWTSGTGEPTLARRRMRTLALAAVALTVAVLLLAAAGRRDDGGSDLPTRVAGLASAALFLAGFAPPARLRRYWRRREVRSFRAAQDDLMRAESVRAVAEILLPHAAALVGARTAVLAGGDGQVLARYGLDEAAAASVAERLAPPGDPKRAGRPAPDLVVVPVGPGWLAVTTARLSPLPGHGEVALLRTLGHLAGLALDRAELYDREREGRLALAERESELAEAQRTAQIGSYTWDLGTGEVRWSEQMYRLLGYEPGSVLDHSEAFSARVHPEDLEAVAAAWRSVVHLRTPSTIEYRVLHPGGEVRWVHGRVQPILDGGGTPVRLTGTLQDISERKASEQAFLHQATHDALTQLPNRNLFLERVAEALAREGRTTVAVLLLDLDRFTWVNDSLGHSAGDALLAAAATRLRGEVGAGGVLARLGGDEFGVLWEGTSAQGVRALAERTRAVLAEPFPLGDTDTSVTASVGVAFLAGPERGESPETLLRDADVALYRAKERGRDRHEVFDPTSRLATLARHDTVNAMRRGISRGEFVVEYQPEIEIRSNRVVAVEALLRWRHPTRGVVPPGEFVPLAEQSGLILALGHDVLRTACQQAVLWQRGGAGGDVAVSVNLAARQLMDPSLSPVVEEALGEAGLDPSLLVLEITESVLLDDTEASAEALRRLKAVGVRIAVDDFGTGFSALTYLKCLPLDLLKVDRSFVRGLERSRGDRAIVAGLVDLAHAFGLATVAEGVETAGQLAELHDLGCEIGQGFLWSPPLPARELREWMGAHAQPRPAEACAAAGTPRRVLIVDDDPGVRYLMRLMFDDDGRYEVVGEAADGRQAVAMARQLQPAVILLDLAMPGMGGLEALPLLDAVVPEAKVVVLTGLEQESVADTARRRGADALLLKGEATLRLPELVGALLEPA